MSQSIKLADDALVDDARAIAEVQSRSLAGQITHWARIGRAIEKSGSFDHNRITQVLAGKQQTTVLSLEERAVWSDLFLTKITGPGPGEEEVFSELRRSGTAVGLDEHGKVVRLGPSGE